MPRKRGKVKLKRIDRIKGALYGFAIGDAMGATTEFMTKEQIKRQYGEVTDIIGGGWLNLKVGEVTDDTEMMLCVCEAIERFPQNTNLMLNRCCENFTNWYLMGPKDVGGCIGRVIGSCKYTNDHNYWMIHSANPQSLGNGSLMRTMPIVLAGLKCETALFQGRLTHNNQTCDNAIIQYYNALKIALNGMQPPLPMTNIKMTPEGHVVNTLHNSLFWANLGCFEDAIIGAVNDGGDADTIAAITGSLAGAYYGFDAIPERWVKQLDPVVRCKLDIYAKLFEKICKKVCTN